MPRSLSRLLGDDSKQRLALNELQRMTRDDSDVRLIAEILARAHSIIRSLGLDPGDTTAEEVYQALQAIAPRAENWAPFKASDWVLLDIDGQVISFHPIDVIDNYHHQLPLGQHQTSRGRRGLGFEIARRYKDHPKTHNSTVERVVCEGGICYIASAVGEPVKSVSPFQLPVASSKPKNCKLAGAPLKSKKSGSKKSNKNPVKPESF